MSKFSIFFISLITLVHNLLNEYTINLVNLNLSSNYIIPVISPNEDLYIVTGLSENNDQNKYPRQILNYSSYSGALVQEYFYESNYSFEGPEIICAGDNFEYLLTYTINSIELFEWKNYKLIEQNEVFDSKRRTISRYKGTSYYQYSNAYIYKDNFYNNSNIVIESRIIFNNGLTPGGKVFPVEVLYDLSMASCSSTSDRSYLLCATFSNNKKVNIIVKDQYSTLLLQDEREIVPDVNSDYFIKISYLKDKNKFVIFNSQSDYLMRFRFFEYSNKNFINLLEPLNNDNGKSSYLDISGIQLSPYQYNNDIIVVNSSKIITISVNEDKIAISILHILDNDTALLIRTYNMFDFLNYGYSDFGGPRLALFKNSIVVCLVSNNFFGKNSGYFFISYPQTIDINLKTTTILRVSDLISIENNIFLLNFKIKFLQIPKNFTFISSLNSRELKEGDELEYDDSIIISKYRKNEGNFFLIYKGIAYGNDIGISVAQIFPEYKKDKEKDSNIIYIEGRNGEIKINFKNCMEGYYEIEDDKKVCINFTPKEYYFDENEKIYKKCNFGCLECFDPMNYNTSNSSNMNCIKCKNNYYLTEDTNSCYNDIPDNYYLDNDQILKRCH